MHLPGYVVTVCLTLQLPKKLPNCFQHDCVTVYFVRILVSFFFSFRHSSKWVMSHGFNLHFSNDKWCLATFGVVLAIPYIFSDKCLSKLFASFLIGMFVLSLRYLYILRIIPLWDKCIAKLFSQTWTCLLISLMVPFEIIKFW